MNATPPHGRGLLGRDEIKRRLRDPESQFAITPIIDPELQFDRASVDLRLGPDMIVTRRATGLALFDPARVEEVAEHLRDYQDYLRRPMGSAFYLHPGEFVIARTLEYVTLPDNLSAQALGRSSWGRLGLLIATATMVQPGFRGTITLELSNVGRVPIVLYVGVRIAQIALHEVNDGSLAQA
jgi:dCTP deaminase